MKRLSDIVKLFEEENFDSAIHLYRKLKIKYSKSPNLSKYLNEIEKKYINSNKYLELIDYISEENLEIKKTEYFDYEYIHDFHRKACLSNLIIKLSNDSSFSTNFNNSLRIYKGSVAFPIQSIVKSRVHLKFKEANNINFSILSTKNFISRPENNSQKKEVKLNNKELILDINDDNGQSWLCIEKDSNDGYGEFIIE